MQALKSIYDVDERFINIADRYWWAYRIALEFTGLNPHDVKKWDADEIMETLAAIGMIEKNRKNQEGGK